MKILQTKLITSIFKSDLLITKQDTTNFNLTDFNKIIISIKQLIKIIACNKKLPLFLICQNKQYSMLIKRYLYLNSHEASNTFLITYKTAVTLKAPAVYLLIDCENSGLLCSKIYQQSNSLVFLIEKTYLNQHSFGEYNLGLNIICVKQILFLLTIIKKIKSTYENI